MPAKPLGTPADSHSTPEFHFVETAAPVLAVLSALASPIISVSIKECSDLLLNSVAFANKVRPTFGAS
mgnify:CR=1 FL=1